jgi:hypothetical protein
LPLFYPNAAGSHSVFKNAGYAKLINGGFCLLHLSASLILSVFLNLNISICPIVRSPANAYIGLA